MQNLCDFARGVVPAEPLRKAGVTCSISTNNVLNPFTPYGDGSLIRMANLYANVCHVSRPADLAGYVLRDQPEWTPERIDAAMHAGSERTVNLKAPIPVYLSYFTAWEENGTLQFREDIYGHDRRQRAAVGP